MSHTWKTFKNIVVYYYFKQAHCHRKVSLEYKSSFSLKNLSSPSEMFFEIGVLKNFAIFTGKHLCWSLFNKVAGVRPATLLKERLHHRCFLMNIAKFLRTAFVIEHLWWLFLLSVRSLVSIISKDAFVQ